MQTSLRAHRKPRRKRRGTPGAETLAQNDSLQTLVQRARNDPHALTNAQALQLQRALGNEQSTALLHGEDAAAQAAQIAALPYAEMTEQERNLRLEAYTRLHHAQAAWLDGIHGGLSEEAALKVLLDNFFARQDFEFTPEPGEPFQGKGDCETLLAEFCLVALEALGIKLEQEDLEGWLFVEGGGRIIDKHQQTGNVDHGAHWVFREHHWLTWNGKVLDVLFGMFGERKQAVEGAEVVDQSTWQLEFADTSVYRAGGAAPDHLYTLVKAQA